MPRVNNIQRVQVRHKITRAVQTVPESAVRLLEPAGWERVKAPAAAPVAAKATQSTAAAAPAGRGDQQKEKK